MATHFATRTTQRRSRQLIATLGLLSTFTACRNQDLIGTSTAKQAIASATAAAQPVRSISFAITMQAAGLDPRSSRTSTMSVERSADKDGRVHTTYIVDDPQRFAGSMSNAMRIVRIEADEKGDATVFLADGSSRPYALDPAAISKAIGSLPDLPASVRTAVNNASEVVARAAPPDNRMSGRWIDALVTTPETRAAAIAALASKANEVRRGANDADSYVSIDGARTMEIQVDSKNNLVLGALFSEQGRVVAEVQYSWISASNGIFVRSGAELTRRGDEKVAATRSKITLSNIALDGKEIRP